METNLSESLDFKTRVIILAIMLTGAFMAVLNITIMNIALPVMIQDFDVEYSTGQWVITSYMLVSSVLIPVTAFLVERFTTRKLFLVAMVLFTAGTLLCAISPNFSILILGRMIQASGTGIMLPLLTVVVLHIFPTHQRGRAMGVNGMVIMVAPAIGPSLGGWVIEYSSWRFLFAIIALIAVAVVILGYFFLQNASKLTYPKIDIRSIILSTLGFGGLLYGFSSVGTSGWSGVDVIGTLIVGSMALLFFILRQIKSEVPMLEFRVFKFSMFTLTTIISGVISIAMFTGMILVPIYVQDVRGFTPFESGLLLLPGSVLMAIMSPITGWVFDKVGAKWLAIIGMLIMAITNWKFSTLTVDNTYSNLMILYTVRMFGMSLLTMPIQTAGLNQLPEKYYSHGAAMSNTMRQLTGAIGMAILITVMTRQTIKYTQRLSITGASDDMNEVVNQATILGINDAFMVTTVLSIIALFLCFFIRRALPDE